MNQSVGAVILAAGKGSRLNSHTVNKVSLPFNGKPIIGYAVELMEKSADRVVVVVGAFADSVKDALKDHPKVIYAHQKEQLGTGHATAVGLDVLDSRLRGNDKKALVLVGYGDHMMFYKDETIKKLIDLHHQRGAVMTLITLRSSEANKLAFGRIIRDEHDNIIKSVEQKDANEDELTVEELNAGFYAFDYGFLKENVHKIPKSMVTGEFYLNSLIQIAVEQHKKVAGLIVPFEEVGIGINKKEELEESQKLHLSRDTR